jgi:hypothetical protein
MRIDPTVPGYCECHRPYEPVPRRPYPYLKDAQTDALPVIAGRPCRILPPLPIRDTPAIGRATDRTPSVICTDSDLRTTQRRRRQREADAEALRSRGWQGAGPVGSAARRAARIRAGAVFGR